MERITVHVAVVRNAYCERDSRTRLTARTREELFAKIHDGQRAHLYGSIVETWEEERIDPEAWAAEQARLRALRMDTCLLPPAEDLQLLSWAKKLPADRWAEIDPAKGSWKTTRGKLALIRNRKYNEDLRSRWAAKT